ARRRWSACSNWSPSWSARSQSLALTASSSSAYRASSDGDTGSPRRSVVDGATRVVGLERRFGLGGLAALDLDPEVLEGLAAGTPLGPLEHHGQVVAHLGPVLGEQRLEPHLPGGEGHLVAVVGAQSQLRRDRAVVEPPLTDVGDRAGHLVS